MIALSHHKTFFMIDANYILKTDLLDLLFDGRNKQYGAYELRKKYNKRMVIAVAVMISCCLLFFLLFAFGAGNKKASGFVIVDTVQLVDVTHEPEKPEVIPPKPKPIETPIKTIQFTTPKLTNEDIKPEEKIPDQTVIADTKIGTITQAGVDSANAIAPPINTGNTHVIEEPKKRDDDDGIVLIVQVESEYPGGLTAWTRYLTRTLPKYYGEEFVEKGIQGRVVVQFIVDKDGNVSDVHGVSGPNELRGIAETVIMKSGKWKPAMNNGRQVKSYKSQPIIFVLEDNQ